MSALCRWCGAPATRVFPEECDAHWELRHRVEAEPKLAARMIQAHLDCTLVDIEHLPIEQQIERVCEIVRGPDVATFVVRNKRFGQWVTRNREAIIARWRNV